MKLLTGHYTIEEAHELQEYLEQNGIAVYLEDEGTRTSGFKYSIFAAIDAQYEDAINLMNNPDHVVSTEIDLEHYHAYVASDEGKDATRRLMLDKVINFLFFVVIFFCAALYAIWKYAQ